MAEQPLSSDHEAALVLSVPQRRLLRWPRARRRPWSGITLARLPWLPYPRRSCLLILIYPGFGTTGASFVLPDYLTRVRGLRSPADR